MGWRVLTQKPASRICHSNTVGDTFSVQCPYHCHLDSAAAPLPPHHLKQYATKKNQGKRGWETNIKGFILREKKKAKSNLLKHKMKGTDYERRTQTLGSRNQRCHSTKPPNGHSVLKRNCSWLTSLSIKKLKQFLLSSLDSIMKLSSLCAKTCL